MILGMVQQIHPNDAITVKRKGCVMSTVTMVKFGTSGRF